MAKINQTYLNGLLFDREVYTFTNIKGHVGLCSVELLAADGRQARARFANLISDFRDAYVQELSDVSARVLRNGESGSFSVDRVKSTVTFLRGSMERHRNACVSVDSESLGGSEIEL
jgi:hypothetical protein